MSITSPVVAAYSDQKIISIIKIDKDNEFVKYDVSTYRNTNITFLTISNDASCIIYSTENVKYLLIKGKYIWKISLSNPNDVLKLKRNSSLRKKPELKIAISNDNRYITILYNDFSLEYFDLNDINNPYLNIIYKFPFYYNWERIENAKINDIAFYDDSKCICMIYFYSRY